MHVDLDLPGYEDLDDDGEPTGIALPYVVTLERSTGEVLAIRRNWDPDDKTKQKRQHFVHYSYIPGFGFYAFGLIHLIGGFAKSGTSILRQLVDAGSLANLPGGFKTRGLRVKGDDTPIAPGEFRDVDVPSGTMKDNIMPLPYKEPSQTLIQLLNQIIEEGRRFAAAGDLKVSDMSANSPVGTTLAILERTLKVMSAIQARMHFSMKNEFKLLKKIIASYAPADYSYEPATGNRKARRKDYEMINIIPVSDPNIFSEAQRFAQMQAVNQLMQSAPNLYNGRAVQLRNLQTLRIPEPETLLLPSDEPESIDPAQENVMAASKKPPSVFEDQDHLAHIETHWQTYRDPLMSQVLFSDPVSRAIMVSHVIEHMRFLYGTAMNRVLSQSAGVDDISQLPQPDDKEVTFQAKQAQAMALVTPRTLAVYQQMVSPFAKDVMMEWQRVQQEQQQMQQQQVQQDRAMIMATTAQSETQRKAAKDQAEIQIKGKELQLNVAKEQHDQDVDKAKLAVESQRASTEKEKNIVDVTVSKQQTEKDLAINQQDNETAAAIAAARLSQQGTAGHLINGNTLTNPNPKG